MAVSGEVSIPARTGQGGVCGPTLLCASHGHGYELMYSLSPCVWVGACTDRLSTKVPPLPTKVPGRPTCCLPVYQVYLPTRPSTYLPSRSNGTGIGICLLCPEWRPVASVCGRCFLPFSPAPPSLPTFQPRTSFSFSSLFVTPPFRSLALERLNKPTHSFCRLLNSSTHHYSFAFASPQSFPSSPPTGHLLRRHFSNHNCLSP